MWLLGLWLELFGVVFVNLLGVWQELGGFFERIDCKIAHAAIIVGIDELGAHIIDTHFWDKWLVWLGGTC